jgi:hypothetical protein
LRVYDTDFENPYVADSLDITPDVAASRSDYGAKISANNRTNRAVESKDMRDYSLNTEAKAMSIHMMGKARPDPANSYYAQIVHKLGYMPTFMVWRLGKWGYYMDSNEVYQPYGYQDSVMLGKDYISTDMPAFSFADTSDISFRGVQSIITDYVAYVILKDPLVIPI